MAKWIFFCRALFPSWRFFVEPDPALVLEVRYGSAPWTESLPKIPRSAFSSIFNPQGNLLHACHNAILHLAQDIENLPTGADVAALGSYRVVHNIARFFLPQSSLSESTYQFRIRDELSSHTLIESPNYER